MLLKKQGYEVDTASKRDEALAKIKDFAPSIVLLDVLLSGADGRELCKEIKRRYHGEAIQVLMISAHPGASDKIADYGADGFISKPVNTKMLLEKLASLTEN